MPCTNEQLWDYDEKLDGTIRNESGEIVGQADEWIWDNFTKINNALNKVKSILQVHDDFSSNDLTTALDRLKQDIINFSQSNIDILS
jgi:hypothetical protein